MVAEYVRQSEEVLVSIVVIGELLFGFRNGSRYEDNLRDLQAFLKDPNVRSVPVTWETADQFGRLSAGLRQSGTPIPSNDVWIASQVLETGACLISSDRHFEAVAGLAWKSFTPLKTPLTP